MTINITIYSIVTIATSDKTLIKNIHSYQENKYHV